MTKKIILIGLTLCLLSMTTVAFAADVYVTKRGKKYHKEDCVFLRNKEVKKIDKDEAIKKHMTPCKKCFKEDISAAESIETDKQTLLIKKDKAKGKS